MIVSFRLRLFLLAMFVVVASLAGVLAVGWASLRSFEIGRLEDRMCMEARRVALQPRAQQRVPKLAEDVAQKLRLNSTSQLMMRSETVDGRTEWQSASWDAGLRLQTLQWRLPGGGAARGECSLAAWSGAGARWRIAAYAAPDRRGIVVANLAAMRAELIASLRGALAMVLPAALGIAALGAWMLASLAMRPLARLRRAMEGLTQRGLEGQLSDEGEDREFRVLIATYNDMLRRLEASFRQASRFSADAAHELRTPLTVLQGRVENALRRAAPAQQTELAGLLDEVGRLAGITRKLLLSQADAGRLALHRERLDIAPLLDELVSDAQMLLGEQRLTVEVARPLELRGDEQLLRQLFNNLISNAVRYGLPAGAIHVAAGTAEGGVEVVFSNDSRPIPAAERARFFDRFYRGDPAHGRQVEGSGLGLSLAREIARAHGGELALLAGPITQVRLRLWLPAG